MKNNVVKGFTLKNGKPCLILQLGDKQVLALCPDLLLADVNQMKDKIVLPDQYIQSI